MLSNLLMRNIMTKFIVIFLSLIFYKNSATHTLSLNNHFINVKRESYNFSISEDARLNRGGYWKFSQVNFCICQLFSNQPILKSNYNGFLYLSKFE